eukprot:gnl/TRDRNA2_/TRDRNA2_195232_c0_seq1.p1 gnl/TRDRNA2_/TRDRNA2_195232_c0~~gnl/TRDRNA2_/TRDRNA2_195232_c0_seq1.p1  ORF type:complete len:289 (-),score=7.29 gnl/TRDRNA2_/TRDRNA2_195232_c0_seq1:112-903(-)
MTLQAVFVLCCSTVLFACSFRLQRSSSTNRTVLNIGEFHVVHDFISSEEIQYYQQALDDLGLYSIKPESRLNGADNTRCPSASVPQCPNHAEVHKLQQRVRIYANNHLFANSTLKGHHSYKGTVYDDYGSVRRYHAYDPEHSSINLHTDSDFDGRCLSAGVYLNSPKAKSGGAEIQLWDHPQCRSLQGQRLQDAYHEIGTVRDCFSSGYLQKVNHIKPTPGDLVFFLSENIHSVSHYSTHRDCLFFWMSCTPLEDMERPRRRF